MYSSYKIGLYNWLYRYLNFLKSSSAFYTFSYTHTHSSHLII